MASLTIDFKEIRDYQSAIFCDEIKVHTHLGISADDLCCQVQKIRIPDNFKVEEVPKLRYAIIGPWFPEILDAGVEGSIEKYQDPDPAWHILGFNLGKHLRDIRIDDCARTIKEFGYSALSLRQALYLVMLGFTPDLARGEVGLSLAATILRPPRIAVLYFDVDGKKILGDHWPSYREPFLQVPYGRIVSD